MTRSKYIYLYATFMVTNESINDQAEQDGIISLIHFFYVKTYVNFISNLKKRKIYMLISLSIVQIINLNMKLEQNLTGLIKPLGGRN